MIKSILDTDLYKFSTSYAYWVLYPLAEGTFKFTDRNKETYDQAFLDLLKSEVRKLDDLSLDDVEYKWLINNITYIPSTYWEWLRTFRFDSNKVFMSLDDSGHLNIEVTDLLYKSTLYEVPILAIVSELRNNYLGYLNLSNSTFNKTLEKLSDKIEIAEKYELPFSEFGTRRRFSVLLHEKIVSYLSACKYCMGTSNVYFAMKFRMKPIGTFPHEWIQMHAALFGNKRANYLMLEDWIKVYRGNLGTALTDLFGTKSFLRTLTKQQALLLQGYRIDSGDNYEVGDMIIRRLEEFGIDPKTKLLVFSNALDFDKYKDIYTYFKSKIKVSAGIGTNLTCDPSIEDYKPANIVMKLSKVRMSEKDPWELCIKISDDKGKCMGDPKEISIALYELHLTD